MRKAKELDYWDKAYKKIYINGLGEIDLQGLNGLNKIELAKGISAICGLNGAGKSTIIAAIKDIVGITLTENDIHKLKGSTIIGKYTDGKTTIPIENVADKKLVKMISSCEIVYLDCNESDKRQDFSVRQTNLEELIEQYEEYSYTQDDLNDIKYLTGKRYQICSVWEFEDIEEMGTIPFFKVTIDGMEYDSRSMGKGEYFLLYLFWRINKSNAGTIFIIEEPETYISIYSQMHLANYMSKQMVQNNAQFIFTTHSPYLLGHIRNENIRIVSRMGNSVIIDSPDSNIGAEEILGLKQKCAGTLFVEDRVAYDFLSIILEDKAPYVLKKYTLAIAEGGEKAITKRLEFPKCEKINYNFVGIYDGDMRNRLQTDSLQWEYLFLPGEKPLEELYRDYLHETEGLQNFCEYLEKSKEKMVTILSTIDGDDYHDWFEELRKYLSIDGKELVRAFYNIMPNMNSLVDEFIAELKNCIE